jgi:hypothetical protein
VPTPGRPAHSHSAAALYPAPAVGWYATMVLAFLYWLSILDRFIISLLVDPIKRDMGISDVQFGILHGFAFANSHFHDSTYRRTALLAGGIFHRRAARRIAVVHYFHVARARAQEPAHNTGRYFYLARHARCLRSLITFMRSRLRFFSCHYSGFMLASAVLGGCHPHRCTGHH